MYAIRSYYAVDVPCGLFRFIDVELATKFPDGGTNPVIKPVVSFTSPANNTEYKVGENIEVAVSATDDGSISNVKLYIGNTLVRQDNSAPYEFGKAGLNDVALTNMAKGTYTLKAVATDNEGYFSESFITVVVKDVPQGGGDEETLSLTRNNFV